MATQSDSLNNSLLEHYTILENFKVKCNICKKIFSAYTYNLQSHLIRIHKLTLTSYKRKPRNRTWQNFYTEFGHVTKCNICGKSYVVKSSYLLAHLKAQHPEKLINMIKKIKHDLNPYGTYLEGYKIRCNFCDKVYSIVKTENIFNKHLKMKHSKKTYRLKEHSWIWQYMKKEDNKAKCTICGNVYNIFNGQRFMKKHLIGSHKINAHSKTDKHSEERKTDGGTKQLVPKEGAADASFLQIALNLNTEESKGEKLW